VIAIVLLEDLPGLLGPPSKQTAPACVTAPEPSRLGGGSSLGPSRVSMITDFEACRNRSRAPLGGCGLPWGAFSIPSAYLRLVVHKLIAQAPQITEDPSIAMEGAMPISVPSARADAILAEQAAFQSLADTKSEEEWNGSFAVWREASAALITAHAVPSAASPTCLEHLPTAQ
jgi:hypothetical protein